MIWYAYAEAMSSHSHEATQVTVDSVMLSKHVNIFEYIDSG